MNFAMTESKLVKINNRPEFNNHIENQSIEKMEKICNEAYKDTRDIITKNQTVISNLAELLMKKEYLSDVEVSDFLSKNKIT